MVSGMEQSSITSNRRSRRSNVLLAASVEAGGTVTAVKLRNLSAEGALIESPTLPSQGTDVLFRRNELSIPGRVAWVHGCHAGIAFAQQLQPQEVLRNIPKPRPKLTPEFKRPGLATQPLSPADLQYMKRWF
jgi:hypothetical protein